MTLELARRMTLLTWAALALSLLAWMTAGYPWGLCVAAVVPLLAPLPGLWRGRRYTYTWSALFTVPYFVFALTELIANPGARWVAALSLLLVFAWYCAMVLYLRVARARRG